MTICWLSSRLVCILGMKSTSHLLSRHEAPTHMQLDMMRHTVSGHMILQLWWFHVLCLLPSGGPYLMVLVKFGTEVRLVYLQHSTYRNCLLKPHNSHASNVDTAQQFYGIIPEQQIKALGFSGTTSAFTLIKFLVSVVIPTIPMLQYVCVLPFIVVTKTLSSTRCYTILC